jgi:hypothetical protein
MVEKEEKRSPRWNTANGRHGGTRFKRREGVFL